MATSKAQFQTGTEYMVRGEIATLESAAKGWFTFDNGVKARAKDIKKVNASAAAGKGQRVFRVVDPETGEPAKVAVFKMDRYTRHKGVSTESGNVPIDINDQTAADLRGLSIDEQFEETASRLRAFRDEKWPGTKADILAELHSRYDRLNVGQQRMNLGNVIRGAVKRQEKAEAEAEANA